MYIQVSKFKIHFFIKIGWIYQHSGQIYHSVCTGWQCLHGKAIIFVTAKFKWRKLSSVCCMLQVFHWKTINLFQENWEKSKLQFGWNVNSLKHWGSETTLFWPLCAFHPFLVLIKSWSESGCCGKTAFLTSSWLLSSRHLYRGGCKLRQNNDQNNCQQS